jgi:hypothetical protein
MKRYFSCILAAWMLPPAVLTTKAADAIDNATAKGVAYLISKQDKRGAIRETDAHETAITALGALAIAAMGHLPSDPTPEGESIQKALSFIIFGDRQDREGYFGGKDGSRMYGHGITTLFLSEMLGMGTNASQDEALKRCTQQAVELILRSQKVAKRNGTEGGWRYTPQASDSDLSVSIWQLMALRAAKDAGISVPKDAIDAAVGYIKRSFKDTGRVNTPVGFSYEINQTPVWSTAAEGLLALQVCGEYDAKEVLLTADWLLQNPPKPGTSWFYYGTYYYAQGMYQRGGEHAESSAKRVAEVILALQDDDGSWKISGGNEGNRIYRTAMALLSLSVKYHYLPIYQR